MTDEALPAAAAPLSWSEFAAGRAFRWALVALAVSTLVLAGGWFTGRDFRDLLRHAALGLTLVAAVEDLRTRRIRNVLTAPAVVLALAGAPLLGSAALGMVLAPLPLLVLSIASPAAMGMGDVKLASVAGALVGLSGVVPWWVGTALAGGVLAVIAIIRGGRRGGTLAYGPALVISLVWVLFAPTNAAP